MHSNRHIIPDPSRAGNSTPLSRSDSDLCYATDRRDTSPHLTDLLQSRLLSARACVFPIKRARLHNSQSRLWRFMIQRHKINSLCGKATTGCSCQLITQPWDHRKVCRWFGRLDDEDKRPETVLPLRLNFVAQDVNFTSVFIFYFFKERHFFLGSSMVADVNIFWKQSESQLCGWVFSFHFTKSGIPDGAFSKCVGFALIIRLVTSQWQMFGRERDNWEKHKLGMWLNEPPIKHNQSWPIRISMTSWAGWQQVEVVFF